MKAQLREFMKSENVDGGEERKQQRREQHEGEKEDGERTLFCSFQGVLFVPPTSTTLICTFTSNTRQSQLTFRYWSRFIASAQILEECRWLIFPCLACFLYMFCSDCPRYRTSLRKFLIAAVALLICTSSSFLRVCTFVLKWRMFNEHLTCRQCPMLYFFVLVHDKQKCFAPLSDGWPRSADTPGFTHSSTEKWWALSPL